MEHLHEKFHYNEALDFYLTLLDAGGHRAGWPDFSWHAQLWTEGSAAPFNVYSREGHSVNCHNDAGRIHIIAADHRLAIGRLHIRLTADVPDKHFPGGIRKAVVSEAVDIDITDRTAGIHIMPVEITLRLPVEINTLQQPSIPSTATAATPVLTVADNGELIAHGVQPLLDAGLTPVLFRCLWRSNELTGDGEEHPERCREKRWTRFTRFGDAVAIDAYGVLSFRTDLLAQYHNDHAERSTSASALLLREEPAAVVYGRRILDIDDMRALRMLCFPFVLGFIDASDDGPERRWTLADCVATVPFRVRFTPVFHYEKDEVTRAECFVGFELK